MIWQDFCSCLHKLYTGKFMIKINSMLMGLKSLETCDINFDNFISFQIRMKVQNLLKVKIWNDNGQSI